jgi:hypothetical protein
LEIAWKCGGRKHQDRALHARRRIHMQSLPQSAVKNPLASGKRKRTRRREELIYEAMTIGAMIIVLITVWVF